MDRSIKQFKCKKCKTIITTRGYIEEFCDDCLYNFVMDLQNNHSIFIQEINEISTYINYPDNMNSLKEKIINLHNLRHNALDKYHSMQDKFKKSHKPKNLELQNNNLAKVIQRMFVRRYQKTEKGKLKYKELSDNRYDADKKAGKKPRKEIIQKRLNIFGKNICCYCNKESQLELEHLIPISDGGTNKEENLFGACSKCNQSKGNNNWIEWFRAQPFYDKRRENKIKKLNNLVVK